MKTCTQCHKELPDTEFYMKRADCKPCVKTRSKEWRLVNRDKHRAMAKAWEQQNTEHVKLRKKTWVENNRQRHSESNKRWALKNPNKIKARTKKWYEANREHAIARDAAWARANRDRKRVHEFTRRALESKAKGAATAIQIKARVEFYGACCWICGAPFDAIDHALPLARGGTNWPANLRPICKTHNSSKGAKHPLIFLRQLAENRA